MKYTILTTILAAFLFSPIAFGGAYDSVKGFATKEEKTGEQYGTDKYKEGEQTGEDTLNSAESTGSGTVNSVKNDLD